MAARSILSSKKKPSWRQRFAGGLQRAGKASYHAMESLGTEMVKPEPRSQPQHRATRKSQRRVSDGRGGREIHVHIHTNGESHTVHRRVAKRKAVPRKKGRSLEDFDRDFEKRFFG